MSGETNLKMLLGSMRPELQPETYVFVTLPRDQSLPEGVPPLMVFGEKEG